jgi:hypothetical protein
LLLVFSTALPVWQKLRAGGAELNPDGGTEGRGDSDD